MAFLTSGELPMLFAETKLACNEEGGSCFSVLDASIESTVGGQEDTSPALETPYTNAHNRIEHADTKYLSFGNSQRKIVSSTKLHCSGFFGYL